jgi:hypothetical protein
VMAQISDEVRRATEIIQEINMLVENKAKI